MRDAWGRVVSETGASCRFKPAVDDRTKYHLEVSVGWFSLAVVTCRK